MYSKFSSPFSSNLAQESLFVNSLKQTLKRLMPLISGWLPYELMSGAVSVYSILKTLVVINL